MAWAIIFLIPVWLAGPMFSPHTWKKSFFIWRGHFTFLTLSSLTRFSLWKTKMRQLLLSLFFFKLESECLPRPAWQACSLPTACHFSSPERLSSSSLTYSGPFPPRALAQNVSFLLLYFTDTYLLDKLQVSADTSFLTLRLGQLPILYDFIEADTTPAEFLARL